MEDDKRERVVLAFFLLVAILGSLGVILAELGLFPGAGVQAPTAQPPVAVAPVSPESLRSTSPATTAPAVIHTMPTSRPRPPRVGGMARATPSGGAGAWATGGSGTEATSSTNPVVEKSALANQALPMEQAFDSVRNHRPEVTDSIGPMQKPHGSPQATVLGRHPIGERQFSVSPTKNFELTADSRVEFWREKAIVGVGTPSYISSDRSEVVLQVLLGEVRSSDVVYLAPPGGGARYPGPSELGARVIAPGRSAPSGGEPSAVAPPVPETLHVPRQYSADATQPQLIAVEAHELNVSAP